MSKEAEELRKTLRSRREQAEVEEKRAATEAERQKAERAELLRLLGSIVRPVFEEAAAAFTQEGYEAKVTDKLDDASQSIYLRVGERPKGSSGEKLTATLRGDRASFSFSMPTPDGPVEADGLEVSELTAEKVWSMVYSLAKRLPL